MKLLRALLGRRKNWELSAYQPKEPFESHVPKYSKDYANLPERYIMRKSRRIRWQTHDHPAYDPRLDLSPIRGATMDRPWTTQYWQDKPDPFKREHGTITEPIRNEVPAMREDKKL